MEENSLMNDPVPNTGAEIWKSRTYGNKREKCFPGDITSNDHVEMNIEITLFYG